jgi:recombination protein RecA
MNADHATQGTIVLPGVRRGLDGPAGSRAWDIAAFRGRLAEISGGPACAALTLAFRLVLQVQRDGEPVAWISRKDSVFFPPDAADAGVDLSSMAVVWSGDGTHAARAADHLVRSGAFGLVVLDLGLHSDMPRAFQTRLSGLARKHATALVCLTEKNARHPALGSLVSLRAEVLRTRGADGNLHCEVRIVKDKLRGPGWRHCEVCHAPDGLR